ncbi:hypothetical protein MRX96_043078 [Rhipicephalus microplus]
MLLTHTEVLLFLFGLALFTISSCGCVGALRENTFLLRVYSFALTILIVVTFVLGVLVYFVPGSCPDATNRYVKEHVMIIGGVCLVAVIVLAFIDMVTNAVIDEIDIIRKIYDHINGAEAGVSSAFTT